MNRLVEWFEKNNKAALAFSGGTDSTFLLYAALTAKADVTAYYVRSEFQPEFEYADALGSIRWMKELGLNAVMKTIEISVLDDERIAGNTPERCYYCKKTIMTQIASREKSDGYDLLVDGTNSDDAADDRPGMRATAELGVRSPLRELGYSKDDVRRLSEDAGLPTAQKPAYACLATRIPVGESITASKLKITEASENYLMKLGYRDFRIRMLGDAALIQVKQEQMRKLTEELDSIREALAGSYSHIEIGER